MTAHPRSLSVHSFLPAQPRSARLTPAHLDARSANARRLIRSLRDPPATVASSSAHKWDEPEQPLANTRSYISVPPLPVSPSALRTRARARAPAPSTADDPRALPPFAHWVPPPPRARSPSSPPPQQTQQLTQGTLKTAAKRAGFAGGWASGATDAGRERKKVRVESPRSTAAAAAAGMKRKGKARELVPPTPVPREEREERERPDLAVGAVKRCIPYPYTHPVRAPRETDDLNPGRQHPSPVLYSFVDPSFVPAPAPTSSTQTQTQSALPSSSAATLAYLAPGRRGAWLLPLSAPLPLSHAALARPAYFLRAPPPSQPGQLAWTDARVRAVWSVAGRLAASGAFGLVRCSAYFPPSAPGEGEWPEMLRLACPAHLALAVRGLLGQVSVRAVSPGEDDGDKFLRGRGLLWVDEEGGDVLIA